MKENQPNFGATSFNSWDEYFQKNRLTIFDHALDKQLFIERIIDATPSCGMLLETGCGSGLVSLMLADHGFKVTALDLSSEVLAAAKKRCPEGGLDLHFVHGDMFSLDALFPEMVFDTIFHSGVLEHFDDTRIVEGLSQQRRHARRVIFMVPSERYKNRRRFHFGDERFLKIGYWTKLIRRAGFSCIHVSGTHDLPVWSYALPRIFFHRKGVPFWWKYFSAHLIFVCQ